MANFVKCLNPNCITTIERVKKGGHWKKFCSSKCRSQYHSNTSSKYATPQMIGSVSLGSSIETTVANHVNHAVSRVSGNITDRLIGQIEGKLNQFGIPIPYYTIGAVALSQLTARLFGVEKFDTKMSLAKWFGGIGLVLDYSFSIGFFQY